jgi:hypothetical protein
MKLRILIGIIGASLLLGGCFRKPSVLKEYQIPSEYNVGICGPSRFIGIHGRLTKEGLIITALSPGPGIVKVLPKPDIFPLGKVDTNGFIRFGPVDGVEFAFSASDPIGDGYLFIDGEKTATVMKIKNPDSKLQDDAFVLFEICQKYREHGSSAQ